MHPIEVRVLGHTACKVDTLANGLLVCAPLTLIQVLTLVTEVPVSNVSPTVTGGAKGH